MTDTTTTYYDNDTQQLVSSYWSIQSIDKNASSATKTNRASSDKNTVQVKPRTALEATTITINMFDSKFLHTSIDCQESSDAFFEKIASGNKFYVMQAIRRDRVNPRLKNKEGDTLLRYALRCNQYDIVNDFFAKFALLFSDQIREKNDHNEIPLFDAIRSASLVELEEPNQLEIIKLLIAHGSPLDTINTNQETLFHVAAALGKVEIFDLLVQALEEGYSEWTDILNHPNTQGYTAGELFKNHFTIDFDDKFSVNSMSFGF